jgi:hypothetical protein
MQRGRAFWLYLAMTVPFGIAVHLGSEFAGLGRDADDLAFSPLHGYLALLAVVAAGIFLVAGGFFASRAERTRRISLLTHALPFRGRGPAFIAFSAAIQFAFFVTTQLGEGCPLCHGDIFVGILAALVASILGACVLSALRTRLVSILIEASTWLERSTRKIFALRIPRHELRVPISFFETVAPTLGNRPPPCLI